MQVLPSVRMTANLNAVVRFQTSVAEAAAAVVGRDVAHHVVDSDHGHDAFLVEPGKLAAPLRDFLAEGVEGSGVQDTEEEDVSESSFAPVHASLFGES